MSNDLKELAINVFREINVINRNESVSYESDEYSVIIELVDKPGKVYHVFAEITLKHHDEDVLVISLTGIGDPARILVRDSHVNEIFEFAIYDLEKSVGVDIFFGSNLTQTMIDVLRYALRDSRFSKHHQHVANGKTSAERFSKLVSNATSLINNINPDDVVKPRQVNFDMVKGKIQITLPIIDIIVNLEDTHLSLHIGFISEFSEPKVVLPDIYNLSPGVRNVKIFEAYKEICGDLVETLPDNDFPKEYLDPDLLAEFTMKLLTIN